jgi:hypothetical protein
VLQYFEILAVLFSGLFAGANLYITLIEHPSRMECGVPTAVAVFGPVFRRASKLNSAMAALGFLGGFEAWWFGRDVRWLVGAILLVAVIPFTLVAVMPVNARLLEDDLDRYSPEAKQLLTRWGRLQIVRLVLGIAAFGTFLAAWAKS